MRSLTQIQHVPRPSRSQNLLALRPFSRPRKCYLASDLCVRSPVCSYDGDIHTVQVQLGWKCAKWSPRRCMSDYLPGTSILVAQGHRLCKTPSPDRLKCFLCRRICQSSEQYSPPLFPWGSLPRCRAANALFHPFLHNWLLSRPFLGRLECEAPS